MQGSSEKEPALNANEASAARGAAAASEASSVAPASNKPTAAVDAESDGAGLGMSAAVTSVTPAETAPVAQPSAPLSPEAARLRQVRKKLKQIGELERRVAAGESLTAEQQMKLESKATVMAEVGQIVRDFPELDEEATKGEEATPSTGAAPNPIALKPATKPALKTGGKGAHDAWAGPAPKPKKGVVAAFEDEGREAAEARAMPRQQALKQERTRVRVAAASKSSNPWSALLADEDDDADEESEAESEVERVEAARVEAAPVEAPSSEQPASAEVEKVAVEAAEEASKAKKSKKSKGKKGEPASGPATSTMPGAAGDAAGGLAGDAAGDAGGGIDDESGSVTTPEALTAYPVYARPKMEAEAAPLAKQLVYPQAAATRERAELSSCVSASFQRGSWRRRAALPAAV